MKIQRVAMVFSTLVFIFSAGGADGQAKMGIRSKMEGSHTIDQKSWFVLEIQNTRQKASKKSKDSTEVRTEIRAEITYHLGDEKKIFSENGASSRATRAINEYLDKFGDSASRNNRRESGRYVEDMLAYYDLGEKPEWRVEYDENDKAWTCACESVIINEKITLYHVEKAQPARPQAQRPEPPNFRKPYVVPGYR
jgi:hypothetical protein